MRYAFSLILLLGLLMASCSQADTLGDEPPVEVVITGEPTYANGVAELLELKCGYCHAYPRPATAPNNIVADLDLTTYATRIRDGKVIRGADAIGRFIKDGLFQHDVNLYADNRDFPAVPIDIRQMPLDYGTPLTSSEKNALLHWAEAGLPATANEPTLDGNADNGADDWGSCNFCHGFVGEGMAQDGGRILGPPLEEEAVTLAKIKSMWLWSQALNNTLPAPLSDQRAADLRSFIFSLDKQSPGGTRPQP